MTAELPRRRTSSHSAADSPLLQHGARTRGRGELHHLRLARPEIPPPHVVAVVDDDTTSRDVLDAILMSAGLESRWHDSIASLLTRGVDREVGCLLIDVRLPGKSGLALQQHLFARNVRTPIIMSARDADVSTAVSAMRSGAINFVEKPFQPRNLLTAIHEAIDIEARRQKEERAKDHLRDRATRLTPREMEVLTALDRGLVNKQIAAELGISLITVKMHRSNAFRKLEATSVTDMVQKVRDLELGRC
ncbi:response regulator transcription factor [Bradyrhizobium sp. SZCCHNR1015]|uniref:response regulator transcription factor n=1 Tax=Bradyrhizobium sp. SZCCHNR1015 TaxID=3057338 RepID=UPI002916CBDC|nr:response regulator [Bradyrhizobium sp. SZCCHNR1015]